MKVIYLETTIISYLVSRQSSDPRLLTMQKLTWEWWNYKRDNYSLLISQAVLDEISIGDPEQVKNRLEIVKNVDVISQSSDILAMAKILVSKKIVPAKADIDALHIAYAAMSGADALLTWNCKHLANLNTQRALYSYLALENLECPVICTPFELMEESYDG